MNGKETLARLIVERIEHDAAVLARMRRLASFGQPGSARCAALLRVQLLFFRALARSGGLPRGTSTPSGIPGRPRPAALLRWTAACAY